jgi:hypothetical protein
VVARPVGRVGLGAAGMRAAVLEADRVGRKHADPPLREQRAEGLERVAGQGGRLALAQVVLAVVLVVDEDGGERTVARRGEELRRYLVSVRARVRGRRRDLEAEEVAQRGLAVAALDEVPAVAEGVLEDGDGAVRLPA